MVNVKRDNTHKDNSSTWRFHAARPTIDYLWFPPGLSKLALDRLWKDDPSSLWFKCTFPFTSSSRIPLYQEVNRSLWLGFSNLESPSVANVRWFWKLDTSWIFSMRYSLSSQNEGLYNSKIFFRNLLAVTILDKFWGSSQFFSRIYSANPSHSRQTYNNLSQLLKAKSICRK